MESIIQDLRYAVRQLTKNPGFTAVAVITLALGVGANAAVFSAANWVLYRPVPGVRDPSRLSVVQLWYTEGERTSTLSLNYPQADAFANRARSFAGVTFVGSLFSGGAPVLRYGDADPQAVAMQSVGHNYFEVLGVPVAAGRTFTRAEEMNGRAAPVAVMSFRAWSRLFTRAPDVVDRLVEMNGVPVRIVGVAARGFAGDDRLTSVDFFVPILTAQAVAHFTVPFAITDARASYVRELIVRSRPGISAAEATDEVARLMPQVMRENPRPDAGPEVTFAGRLFEGIGTPVNRREYAARPARLLVAASGLIVLIAAANLANLLLFRASSRRGELAVRRALGAGSWRVVRQQLTEGTVLAVTSGALAVLLAFWFVGMLQGPLVPFMEIPADVRPDSRVIVFALSIAAVTGLVASAVPLIADRRDVSGGLRQGTERTTSRRAYLRSGLAVTQLAVSLTLLVGALLLIGTLRNLRSVDVGFDPRRLTAFSIDLRRSGMAPETVSPALAEIERRLRSTPGMEAVSTAMYPPFGRASFIDRVQRAGAEPGATPIQVVSNTVSPGYFGTLNIEIKTGRIFSESEVTASLTQGPMSRNEQPVVINELLARQAFGGTDAAIGEIVNSVSRSGAIGRPYRVVGVAKDTRWLGFADEVGPMVYQPAGIMGSSLPTLFLVRASMDVTTLDRAVRDVLRAVAPNVLPARMTALTEYLEQGIAEQRMFGKVLVALSALAVILAVVGLYGLIAFGVNERRREFGIRLALGAESARIVRMVLRQGVVLAAIGVPLGLVGAFGLSRLIANRLFGVSPVEPVLYGAAAVLLVGVSIVACLVPARTASSVDPMIALRSE